jgi:hypothetical protein
MKRLGVKVMEQQRKKVDHMDRRGANRTGRKRRGKNNRIRAEKEEKQRKRLIGRKKEYSCMRRIGRCRRRSE